MQRIHEKKLSYPLPSATLIDGEATKKRGRHHGIGRKFPGHLRRQTAQVNAEGRERIVADDSFGGVRRNDNKRRRDKSARVLTSHFFEIVVKDGVATRKSRAVVLFAKGLDKPREFAGSRRHLFAGLLFVTLCRPPEAGSGRRSLEKRRNEHLAIAGV